MRTEKFEANKFYLLETSGSLGDKIFIDKEDYSRFIFLITHFQSPIRIYNVSWYTKTFVKKGSFNMGSSKTSDILKNRDLELTAFFLGEKRCRLLIRNSRDYMISVYMQRVLTAYSKYFNSKYSKTGHVFNGPFKSLGIRGNSELLNMSAYIHKGEDDYQNYPWSSFQDYVGFNRWGNMISKELVMSHFKDQMEYIDFVKKSNFKINP